MAIDMLRVHHNAYRKLGYGTLSHILRQQANFIVDIQRYWKTFGISEEQNNAKMGSGEPPYIAIRKDPYDLLTPLQKKNPQNFQHEQLCLKNQLT